MSQQRHVIGQTVLEFNTSNLADVWSLQETVSHLFQQRAVPEMERLFGRLVTADQVVRLDQVVVDLGMLDLRSLEDRFVPALLNRLQQVLGDQLANLQRPERVSGRVDQGQTRADWEVLLYFLQYGRLPWWITDMYWQGWLTRWQTLMQQDTTWHVPLLELISTSPLVRQRLVTQVPEPLRYQWLLSLRPAWQDWTTLLIQARQLLQTLSLSQTTVSVLDTQAWLLLLAELRPNAAPQQPLPVATWMQHWLSAVLQTWQQQTTTPFGSPPASSASPTDSSGSTLSASHTDSSPPSSSTFRVDSSGNSSGNSSDNSPLASQTVYQRLLTLLASFPLNERVLWQTALNQIVASGFSWDRLPQPNSSETQPFEAPQLDPDSDPSSIPQPTSFQRESRRESSSSPLSPEEEKAGIYVNQAGLVLLHPFLLPYLQGVKLVQNETFCNELSQQTAIYLLHYLATRQTEAPEYELVLPKLLCGWPLNEAIAPQPLPETALTEAENLLQTVIRYWDALKSTSPDGLREGFLQRTGKLTQTDSGTWKLQVEQQAIDILLSRLPWGVSMVKLPWMDTFLIVEWT